MSEDRCVCCGEVVPEGRMVCPQCEKGDLISRKALLVNYDRVHIGEPGKVRKLIADAPTVDAVEVVHGRWIHCKGKSNLWYCSACGEKILYNPTRRTYNIEKRPVHEVNKYCRGCGVKMVGGIDDGICKED